MEPHEREMANHPGTRVSRDTVVILECKLFVCFAPPSKACRHPLTTINGSWQEVGGCNQRHRTTQGQTLPLVESPMQHLHSVRFLTLNCHIPNCSPMVEQANFNVRSKFVKNIILQFLKKFSRIKNFSSEQIFLLAYFFVL